MTDTAIEMPKGPQTLRAVWPAMVGLSAVFLIDMLDNSMLNVALPTIGRDLDASTTSLQWMTGGYAVVFGALMLFFGGLADRYGRRRLLLIGLALLTVASFTTLFVETSEQLIALRIVMGIAAAMTAPGTMALAFRLFDTEKLLLRATTVISTVGLIGLAVGPTVGGLLLAVVPWQFLLVVNVPIAILSAVAIRAGIPSDSPEDLHKSPLDVLGAVLGTSAIALTILSPTLFVEFGSHAVLPWITVVGAAVTAIWFWRHEHSTEHPLVDFELMKRPLVSSGLAYEAALGLAMAGLGYTVTLQLQLAWGWSPAKAAIGMFPMVITMIAIGPFVEHIVGWLGNQRAAIIGALTALSGIWIYGAVGRFDYIWVAIALVMLSAGGRVVMTVSALNVMGGLPDEQTSMGAALSDTFSEVSSAIGIAVVGTIIAAVFAGSVADPSWSTGQVGEFESATSIAVLGLALVSTVLAGLAFTRGRMSGVQPA